MISQSHQINPDCSCKIILVKLYYRLYAAYGHFSYHIVSKMKDRIMGRKTIGDIVIQIKNIENQQASFKFDSTSLLLWIKEKTVQMQSRNFPSTLRGIQLEFKKFKEYRAVEKVEIQWESGDGGHLFSHSDGA